MSNSDKAPVIDLQQRHADARTEQDKIGHLFSATRNLALGRIAKRLEALFENVDDALFDMAEKAESNMLQTHYFDGMRELRRKRQLVERVFNEGLKNKFLQFSRGELEPFSETGTPQGTELSMSLVEDEELEESLAVNEMVQRALNRHKGSLFALHERFSVARGGSRVDDDTNPLSPGHVGEAFRESVVELAIEVPVKIIVYKLFDRYVMAGMGRVYDEVNTHLISQGVLPNLKQGYSGKQVGNNLTESRPGHRYADEVELDEVSAVDSSGVMNSQIPDLDTGNGTGNGPGYADYGSGHEPDILQTLQHLLALRQPGNQAPARGNAVRGTVSQGSNSASQLINTISSLQNHVPPVSIPAAGAAPGSVAAAKSNLLSQIRSLTNNAKQSTQGADADTIDLVGMLFEYILRDRNLPPTIQASLARLQIPYLKVAVLDRHFFAMREHPARRLLDEMADAGIGWTEESDKNGALLGKMNETVETLLTEFNDDLAIFDKLLVDFESFMKATARKSEAAEKRTAEATQGKEKLNRARQQAAREILQRIKGIELPPVIHGLLTKPWANALVLTELRQGRDSDAWKNAIEMVENLIWSGLPKSSDNERKRLIRMIPKLEAQLRTGLELVAYHDNDIETLLHDLRQSWALLLRIRDEDAQPSNGPDSQPESEAGSPALKQITELPDGSGALPETGFVEEMEDDVSTAESAPVRAVIDQDQEEAIAALAVGAWLELTQEDGRTMRAKLSWISPISGNYLLVNRRGLKVADMSKSALAEELSNGTAAILEDVSLMDRALDAIANKLRSSDAEAEDKPESETQQLSDSPEPDLNDEDTASADHSETTTA